MTQAFLYSSTDHGGGKRRRSATIAVLIAHHLGHWWGRCHAHFQLHRRCGSNPLDVSGDESTLYGYGLDDDCCGGHGAGCGGARHNAITGSAESRRGGSTEHSRLTVPIFLGFALDRWRIRIFDDGDFI